MICVTEIVVRRHGILRGMQEIREEILQQPRSTLLLCLPSILYVAQNNFIWIAIINLEAVVFHILYQLKILTTAAFSYLLLQRRISWQQWHALVLLCVGCAVIQLEAQASEEVSKAPTQHEVSIDATQKRPRNSSMGLICVLATTAISGFAGAFCEKMLKGGSSVSIRNIQLGVPGLICGLLGSFLMDSQQIRDHGFFQVKPYLQPHFLTCGNVHLNKPTRDSTYGFGWWLC
mmetsp:Transcript_29431/g.46139  ORF Transcript_29431/g.46139 Transcript_29431/m.46139 type:complete len:232 (-) Transcript_29431:476-1171(-)